MKYEDFMKDYDKMHKCCPVCGSKHHSTTFVAYLYNQNHPEKYVDRNKVECCNCGWIGIKHEMVPEIITGVELIAEERKRQIEKEGWTKDHDKEHYLGQLADAAVSYALTETERKQIWKLYTTDEKVPDVPPTWPWEKSWWKPTPNDRVKELVKAGALIAAEIDRLLEQNKAAN